MDNDASSRAVRDESTWRSVMRIVDVEPVVLRLPDVDVSRADGTQDAFLVRMRTDDGLEGIGEADTSPYLARTVVEMPASHAVARGLRELLVGEDARDVERLWRLMERGTSYYGRAGVALHAISAVDMALWDLAGKAAGKPVHELLGGARTAELPVYASEVMPETAAEVRELAESAVAAGYGALKLGWGPLGQDLDRDLELVSAARDALGPARTLMIDGGQAYTVERAAELARHLAELDVYWFEEPLAPDDYDGYRRLSDASPVRIAAGEADSTLAPFRALVERGGVRVLQPDIARCGGFTVARQIGALAAEHGVEVVPHCFSTGVLVAASLHFASTLAAPTFSEYSVADSPLAGGLLREPFALREGHLAVPTGPGLGVELDAVLVDELRFG
jgi:L-alanine-DL-glutamate epimerase-like enolase superfamily enzyme